MSKGAIGSFRTAIVAGIAAMVAMVAVRAYKKRSAFQRTDPLLSQEQALYYAVPGNEVV